MNYVFSLKNENLDAIFEYYQDNIIPSSSDSIKLLVKTMGYTITIYQSNKMVIQGREALEEALMWEEIFGIKFTSDEPKTEKHTPVDPPQKWFDAIGSDEVGTGDFFGPVVVCSCLITKEDLPLLEKLKIKDSKKLTDEWMLSIADELMKQVEYTVLTLPNRKFNELTRNGYNLNKIKAYLHNHAIKKLVQKTKKPFKEVIIDQFCTKEWYFKYLDGMDIYQPITMVEKGESYHLSVACASVIARITFLREMDKINEKIGIHLPLGASQSVDLIGKLIAIKNGLDIFEDIAKVNFKNMDKIIALIPNKKDSI